MKIYSGISVGIVMVACLYATRVQADPCPNLPGWFKTGTGPKIGGPNRQTFSPVGYSAATGTFARLGRMRLNLTNNNEHGNKPTVYLGTTGGGAEIDAGFQYEPLPIRGVDAGWVLFMRITIGSCYKWIPSDRDNPRRFDIQTGPVEFAVSRDNIATVSSGNFFPLSCDFKDARPQPLNLQTIKVKRIIGLTQGEFIQDGSHVLKTSFSGGMIGKWEQDAQQKWHLNYGDHWPTSGSDMNNTSKGKNPLGTYIIDLEPPWKRLPNGDEQAPDAHNPNKFTQETVNIDLRGKQIDKKKLTSGVR